MTPETESKKHQEYKLKTARVVTWLSSTSLLLGYQQTTSSLLSNHGISTKEMIDQSVYIANSCHGIGLTVPINIQHSLKEAIEARKLCKAFHESRPSLDDALKKSAYRHSYFLEVLETMFLHLLPFFAKVPAANQTTRTSPALARFPKELQQLEFENAFTPSAKTERTEKFSESGFDASDNIGSFEVDRNSKIPFMGWCFFKEQAQIRQYLRTTWEHCAQGRLNKMEASVITDVALELVGKDETQLVQSIMKSNPLTLDQNKIAQNSYLYIYEAIFFLNKDTDGPTPEQAEEIIHYKTFQTLWYATSVYNESTYQFTPGTRRYREDKYRGTFSEKTTAEDELIIKLFHELAMKRESQASWAPPGPKYKYLYGVEDRITRYLQAVLFSKELTFEAVFAVRILLDIIEVLGPKAPESYREVRHKAAIAKLALEIQWG